LAWLVGVDVGGTFTDFYAYDDAKRSVRLYKRPSTPDNPAAAIAEGLREMRREFGIAPAAVARVNHGTTVATNALIQRRGGKVAVITTKGFRDLLEIGRQTRPHMYSLQIDHPEALVPRQRRFEVEERITAGPAVLVPIEPGSLDRAVEAVRASGAEACAVCLLFSFLDGRHERVVGATLARADGGLFVSLSSDVQPEFREYERFSTAVLNAYLQPVVARYVAFLEAELTRDMATAKIGIYQSSGGLMSPATARSFPIRTALSGPAAGAVGAIAAARGAKRPNIITLDMGGTSADVALIRNYEADVRFDREVAGFPVRLPMVDIHTIGAGGGSIAWFDRDGLLKVGPLSAGADPGPACYGRGGTKATVTDANLVLGHLSERGLIGGRMRLDRTAAVAALAPLADRLAYPVERVACGIVEIVVANMVRAIRTVSVERGHDPRAYCLLPFGGAGPLHASDVARRLGIREFVVPPAPGLLCAQGLIASDLKEDFVRSLRIPAADTELVTVGAHVAELARDAERWFAQERAPKVARALHLSLDMRYVGQNFELRVPIGRGAGGRPPALPDAAGLRRRFFAVHDRHYGFHSETDPVEIINIRMTASAALARLREGKGRARPGPAMPIEHRPVWFARARPMRTPVYERVALAAGQRLVGPAIIEQLDSTTVLHPGDRLRIDSLLNLCVEVGP
jgi:N-methylhydantoinase A